LKGGEGVAIEVGGSVRGVIVGKEVEGFPVEREAVVIGVLKRGGVEVDGEGVDGEPSIVGAAGASHC